MDSGHCCAIRGGHLHFIFEWDSGFLGIGPWLKWLWIFEEASKYEVWMKTVMIFLLCKTKYSLYRSWLKLWATAGIGWLLTKETSWPMKRRTLVLWRTWGREWTGRFPITGKESLTAGERKAEMNINPSKLSVWDQPEGFLVSTADSNCDVRDDKMVQNPHLKTRSPK